ncbi:MAG: penicillin-binding protein activator [Filomicrobium sp.]
MPSAPQVGAGGQSPAVAPKKRHRPVTIAMLLPLKGFGQAALIGKGLKQAGELALFESDNPRVQLIVKHDDGTSQGAEAAARAAIAEGAEIIVGPLFGRSVGQVAAVARASNVPVLTLSNDRSVVTGGVYLMSYLPQAEVARIVSFALRQGKRRYAALIPAGAYGDTVAQAFSAAVSRGGGQVVALERYEGGANAMLEPAKRVFDVINEAAQLGAPVDAFFLPGNRETLPVLGPQLAYANLDTRTTQLIGLGGWDYPNIGQNAVFVGGWYPGPDPRGWQAFAERFSKTFGQSPPRVASHAYDAVKLAISLSDRPKGQRYTQANLANPAGFDGVDGRFVLQADGLSTRPLAVLQVQKFGATVVEAAVATGVEPQAIGFSGGISSTVFGASSALANEAQNNRPAPGSRRSNTDASGTMDIDGASRL